MGFVAVFSEYSYTTYLHGHGCRIIGLESGFIALACCAYFASGSIGIYNSQIVKGQILFISKIKIKKLDFLIFKENKIVLITYHNKKCVL
jgi:hypothetical protein